MYLYIMYIVKAEVKTEMVPACNEQKAPPSSNLVSPWYRLLATQKMIWVSIMPILNI